MASRSRGRGNPNQDADEERRLWKEIKDKASDVDSMFVSRFDLDPNTTDDRPRSS
jgi:SAGA-associated factor 29